MGLDGEAAESLFGMPASYEIDENLIVMAVYGPFTFVPDTRPWRPEPRDSFLEFLDSWRKARDGVVELSSPSLFDLALGDTLPGYGYVYQGRVYAYGDEGDEFVSLPDTKRHGAPPRSLGPSAPQTKTKPGVRTC